MTAAITANDILAWTRWAQAAETDIESDSRVARIRVHLFPDGLEPEERARRASLVAYVRKLPEPEGWEGWPDPVEVPDDPYAVQLAVPIARRLPASREGLIAMASPAYRRGSNHDGTAKQCDEMRARSSGSPFEAGQNAEDEQRMKAQQGKKSETKVRWRTKG